jgi:hypothetical protein
MLSSLSSLRASRECHDIFHLDSNISLSKPGEWQQTFAAPFSYRGIGDLEINCDFEYGQQPIQAVG